MSPRSANGKSRRSGNPKGRKPGKARAAKITVRPQSIQVEIAIQPETTIPPSPAETLAEADWQPSIATSTDPAESADLDFTDADFADEELTRTREAQARPSDDPLYDAARAYVAKTEAARARKAAGIEDTPAQRGEIARAIEALRQKIG